MARILVVGHWPLPFECNDKRYGSGLPPDAIRSMCDRLWVLDLGRFQFDGPVDEGLAFYERLIQ
jgi:hypothetical protein